MPFQLRFQWLAVHAKRVGIFQKAGARRNGPGRADAERMRRALDAGNQFVIQPFDPVQDVGVTLFLLRLHALAEKFLALGIQNNAFNLRAAEVYADAKHVFKSSAMTVNDSSTQQQTDIVVLTDLVQHPTFALAVATGVTLLKLRQPVYFQFPAHVHSHHLPVSFFHESTTL